MHKICSIAVLATAALLLNGCGGSGDTGTGSFSGSGGSGGTGTTGNGGSTTPTPVYSMGKGSGGAFQAGAIDIAVTSLAAGGTTGLQVSIVDQNGVLYSGTAVTISFNSPCFAAGQANIVATGTSAGTTPGQVSTQTGIASATYTAKGCSGADILTATATVGASTLTASGTITVAASTVGSVQFVSATPATIGLKGTGLGETSTVIFKVVDSSGGPRPGVSVTFALNTTVGGLSLAPATATSAADGTVQTVVNSGTVHTPVRVTATIPASGSTPALSTQSSVLAISTGLPASAAFSIAAESCNVEAFNHDGVTVPVTVRLADRYNNPVPDGTSIAFTTDMGHIDGSCTTPGTTPGDGACKVNWVSAEPRTSQFSPKPGRAHILATAIGEESFTDANGNGFFDTGETFTNLGEPFRSDDEIPATYSVGEYFLDFNHDQLRNAGDGAFKGITCTGNTSAATCSTTTLAIGAQTEIIMSTDGAIITVTGITGFGGTASGLTLAHAASGSLTYKVTDTNGNTMAQGSKISVSASAAVGTIDQPPSNPFTVPCNLGTGLTLGATFNSIATLPAGVASVAGNIIITATSAGGLASSFVIPITIN